MGTYISLLRSCKYNDTQAALEFLKNPKMCNLGEVDSNGRTPLIFACKNEMTSVALKILKWPNKCKLGNINYKEWSALMYACKKGMRSVALDISRRGADALDTANASLQAATKVYEDLVAQKQMNDMQTAKLENDSD